MNVLITRGIGVAVDVGFVGAVGPLRDLGGEAPGGVVDGPPDRGLHGVDAVLCPSGRFPLDGDAIGPAAHHLLV